MDISQDLTQADLTEKLFLFINSSLSESEIIKSIEPLLATDKAVIHSRDEQDQTILMNVSLSGQANVVQFLLSNGATESINEKDASYHWTALMLASMDENPKTVQVLLNHGADITAKDSMNRTALQLAIQFNNTNTIYCFLNLMTTEELEAFGQASENNRILVEGFNKALLKNYFVLRQYFEKKINIQITKENDLEVFKGFPQLIYQIKHKQILAEAPDNDQFDPWYSMSFRIKQHAALLQNDKFSITTEVEFSNLPPENTKDMHRNAFYLPSEPWLRPKETPIKQVSPEINLQNQMRKNK